MIGKDSFLGVLFFILVGAVAGGVVYLFLSSIMLVFVIYNSFLADLAADLFSNNLTASACW